MRLKNLLTGILILLLSHCLAYSQISTENPKMIDSAGEVTAEDLSARLDSLIIALINNPKSTGYFVIYPGSNPVKSVFLERAVLSYVNMKGVDEKRFLVITTVPAANLRIELWIGENGAKPLVAEKPLSYRLPKAKRTDFVSTLLELTNIDGEKSYYSVDCEGGCIEELSFDILYKFLKENSQHKAFVLIRSKNLKRAKTLKSFFMKEIVEYEKSMPDRTVFLYLGKNKINDNRLYSEIEVFLSDIDDSTKGNRLLRYKRL